MTVDGLGIQMDSESK